MTDRLDPEVCRLLAAECTEDDARMEDAPWTVVERDREQRFVITARDGRNEISRDLADEDALGIARTRNNLAAIAARLVAAAELAEQCDLIALQFDAAGIDRSLPLAHQAQALQEKWHAAMLRDLQTEALAERRMVELSDRDATAWTLRQQLEGLHANLTDARRERDALRAQLAERDRTIETGNEAFRVARDGWHKDALTADEVRTAVIDAVDVTAYEPSHGKSSWALSFTEAIAGRVAENLAGRVVAATDQRALDALPPAQRDELDRMPAGQEVPGHAVLLVGREHAAIIDQALAYWDRDLSAPHAQIAEIRKLIGGGS